MRETKKPYDLASLVVVLLTFVLFVLALFTKGFTHDLLLEAGVFLVSVKLIIMSAKITKDTNLILKKVEELCQRPDNAGPSRPCVRLEAE
jgi:hypothetical protein